MEKLLNCTQMKPRLETQVTAVVIADQTMEPTEGVVAHFCNGSRRGCAAIMVELHAVNACAAVLNVLEIILDSINSPCT